MLVNNAGPFADAPFRTLDALGLGSGDVVQTSGRRTCSRRKWRRRWSGWDGAASSISVPRLGFVRTHSVYGLAKAALLHLTESLALELAPTITVKCRRAQPDCQRPNRHDAGVQVRCDRTGRRSAGW